VWNLSLGYETAFSVSTKFFMRPYYFAEPLMCAVFFMVFLTKSVEMTTPPLKLHRAPFPLKEPGLFIGTIDILQVTSYLGS
jgi:hypothetical protein